LGNPSYASDFLKHYATPIILQFVDLDHLIAAPTHYLSNELKEVILDVAFSAHLRDTKNGSDVLLFLEHKTHPSRFVPLQLGTHCFLSLYFGWTATKYSETYRPSIPLMILLYNGTEDIDEEILFQSIFDEIPPELRALIPQFKIIVINMKRFRYGNLPGKPETQAIAESLKRATDGTFGDHICDVLQHVKTANLVRQQTLDLTTSITRYCTWTSNLDSDEIVQSITKVFPGTEGLEMETTIKKGFIQEAIEIGEARGIAKGRASGKLETILDILNDRFGQVPEDIVDALNQRTDEIALRSLAVHAANCSSLDDFAADL
jgi:hypothetical protein